MNNLRVSVCMFVRSFQIDDLTAAMFEDADPYNRGAITYEALKGQLEKHGGLLENLSIRYDEWNRLNDE